MPSNLTVRFDSLTNEGASIAWEFDQTPQTVVVRYEVRWSGPTSGTTESLVQVQPPMMTYTIPNIEARTRYRIEVKAVFSDGSESTTEVHYKFDVPRDPIGEIASVEADMVVVGWESPTVETGTIRRPVNSYEISWQETGSTEGVSTKVLDSTSTSYTITGLKPGATYEISLRARNPLGYSGAYGTTVTTDQLELTPTETPTATPSPTPSPDTGTDELQLEFQDLNADGVTVVWKVPSNQETQIRGFELSWSPTTTGAPEFPITLASNRRSYTLPNVENDILYNVMLVAVLNDDVRVDSKTSMRVVVPRQPVARGELISPTMVKISWDGPIPAVGAVKRPVSGYKLSWKKGQDGSPTSFVMLPPETRSHIVGELESAVLYEFALVAFNDLGTGEAAVFVIETLPIPVSPTPTPTATESPPIAVFPTPTFTPTPTSSTPFTASSSTPRRRSSNSRDVDPDPPEDFGAEKGREGVVVYWDNPRWDGGYKILAYTVDWYPEPPPFPMFLPPSARSTTIYGLKADVNYRMRVRALNRRDDSIPAATRIKLTNTLVRFRSSAPFTGSISYGRGITLKNQSQLPGFEIHADAQTMFWGDHLIVTIKRSPRESSPLNPDKPETWIIASDHFELEATAASRRHRFNDEAGSYQFPAPIKICIEPEIFDAIPIVDYSVAQFTNDTTQIHDSTPINKDGAAWVCATARQLDLYEPNVFAVVTRPSLTPEEAIGSHESQRPEAKAGYAALIVGMGSWLVAMAVMGINHKSHAAADSKPDGSPTTCSDPTTDCSSHGEPSAHTKTHRPQATEPTRQDRKPPSSPPRCKTSSPHAPDGNDWEYAPQPKNSTRKNTNSSPHANHPPYPPA